MSLSPAQVVGLDELFPEDPNLPSLAYQAHENVPIFIPWTHKSIALGTGLDSSNAFNAQENSDLFRRSALKPTPGGKAIYQFDANEGSSSFRQSSSAQAATSYEHMDFKGSASAGGSVLGASGRAEFSKAVSENKDKSKISSQTSLRIGLVKPTSSPRLSSSAIALLQASPSSFHQTYGDYFLGALCIGADTTIFLSTSSSIGIQTEMKSIQVDAKFLGVKQEVYSDHKRSLSSSLTYDLTFSGFDTLSGSQSTVKAVDEASYWEVREQATRALVGGLNLEVRARRTMKSLGVDVGMSLTEQNTKELCHSGLVVELMFLPYCGMKDYIAVTSTRSTVSLDESTL
ncbi:hypothetical protein BOTBODRAFT_181784 [Botryobasidium botryosum FD-172 SS1]|uniref:MACPF domain-containing protein n=1 Tax=Botryobasidium botryosum (strain FD-172 SS1) TaxID=930990 RepID=A0A067LSM9_BOTB1|nr:hypothetical protein BOTBODRAFT_181784 [Botryobasidium botryosum FD-172 SS1]